MKDFHYSEEGRNNWYFSCSRKNKENDYENNNTQPSYDQEWDSLLGFEEKKTQNCFTIDDLLSKIGFRFIQWYAWIALIWWNVGQSMYSYNLPYLELMPELLWKVRNQYGQWTVEKVWSGSSYLHWKIDWHNEMTIHNWLTDTHSLCIGGFKIGLIGSWYFAGVLVATVLSQLSDYIGRKRFIQIWSFCGIIGVYALYYEESLNVRMIFWFVLGMLNSIYFWSYTYLLEISPKNWRGFTNYLFLLIELAVPKMIGSLYFYFGGKEWTSLFSISLVLTPIGFLMILFIPESPSFLINNQKIQNAKWELNYMARANLSKLPPKYEIIDEANNELKSNGGSKFSYFKSAKTWIMLVVMIILLSHANFNLSMWIFFEKIY